MLIDYTFPNPSDLDSFAQCFGNKDETILLLEQIGIDAVKDLAYNVKHDWSKIDKAQVNDAVIVVFNDVASRKHSLYALEALYTTEDALSIAMSAANDAVDNFNERDISGCKDFRHALKEWQENNEDPEGFDDPVTIMLSNGYAELWPDGDVIQHGTLLFNVLE